MPESPDTSLPVRLVRIVCPCGHFLIEAPLVVGAARRPFHFARCERCHQFVTVLVNERAEYCVVTTPSRVDGSTLAWPEKGWR